jgi:hypothetical protein
MSSPHWRPLAAGFLGLFVLGCLIWQSARSLTEMAFEVGSVRRSTVERAWDAPLDRRIRQTLAASGTPYPAYQIIRDNAEQDARVYFLARRSEYSFRVFNRLSALLYPRVLVYVCDTEADWQPEPDELYSTSYILSFDTQREALPAGARPLTGGDDFLLWQLEG